MPIHYTDQVIWPVIDLSNLSDVSLNLKDRRIDPMAAFNDAGIEMIYDPNDCLKVCIACNCKLIHVLHFICSLILLHKSVVKYFEVLI